MGKERYVWGFRIASPDCGRDTTGTFHCVCGKCTPLRVDVSKGGKYRGDNSGDGRYKGEKHVDFVMFKGGKKMDFKEITRTLEKQLQLLFERSQKTGCTTEELVSLTGAMSDISRILLP